MQTLDADRLAELLREDLPIRLVEPHIYSVYEDLESTCSYDKPFGTAYDRVACSALYNRLVWGYSIQSLAAITRDTLLSSSDGVVLDVGCGALAFTANTYVDYTDRPVILLDRSIKLLRMAKARLLQPDGSLPSNLLFLHGDALHLPFKPRVFKTVVALNLLHVLDDLKAVLNEMKQVLAEDGTMICTTLVRNNRMADRYLKFWEDAGEVKSRDIAEIQAAFDGAGIAAEYGLSGNMAFIRTLRFTAIASRGGQA